VHVLSQQARQDRWTRPVHNASPLSWNGNDRALTLAWGFQRGPGLAEYRGLLCVKNVAQISRPSFPEDSIARNVPYPWKGQTDNWAHRRNWKKVRYELTHLTDSWQLELAHYSIHHVVKSPISFIKNCELDLAVHVSSLAIQRAATACSTVKGVAVSIDVPLRWSKSTKCAEVWHKRIIQENSLKCCLHKAQVPEMPPIVGTSTHALILRLTCTFFKR